jgi:hypothetical protein
MPGSAKSALVLQGGGALGAYELGAARAFYKDPRLPMMMASSGCFFAHLSYSLRIASLTSSFFMLAMRTPSGKNI